MNQQIEITRNHFILKKENLQVRVAKEKSKQEAFEMFYGMKNLIGCKIEEKEWRDFINTVYDGNENERATSIFQ